MSDNARDPRIDPRQGDILTTGETFNNCQSDHRIDRIVYGVRLERVLHNRGNCSIATWRKWARNAEVVKTA